jgi:hypothetical protein
MHFSCGVCNGVFSVYDEREKLLEILMRKPFLTIIFQTDMTATSPNLTRILPYRLGVIGVISRSSAQTMLLG